MRRLRRFALAAFVLDALLGAAILLGAGKATAASGASPLTTRYYATEAGCAVLYSAAEGVWRYGGLTEETACTEAGSTRMIRAE